MRFTQQQTMFLGILVLVVISCQVRFIQALALVLIGILLYSSMRRRYRNTFRVHLTATDPVNENIVVACRLAGRSCVFMIDTGYAGPPVLSASYLAIGENGLGEILSVEQRYKHAVQRLESGVSIDEQHGAVDRFISSGQCLAYTSGCTMRLMGIGSTQEQQADMLMCDMLELQTASGGYATPKRSTSNAQADVFVTNPLPSSVHILTCDFLLHSSPSFLSPKRGELILNMGLHEELATRTRMKMQPMRLSGGSFVINIEVGGTSVACTVDTGAPGPICIGASVAKKIMRCSRERHTLRQSGVNGEQVCSEIIRTQVKMCDTVFDDAVVFVNDTNTDHVDGYVGLGVLRAFDMLFTNDGIGFAPNGLPIRPFDAYKSVATVGTCADVDLPCAVTSS